MAEFLAVRDNEKRKTIELRELTAQEDADFEAFYVATRKKYPAPQFDVTLGDARDLETFLKAYPKYRTDQQPQGGGGGDGRAQHAAK